jgi:hypothetical protein
MAAEVACIPDPQAASVRSTMTEAKIQALVDRGLLRPKTEVEWRPTAGEEFPSKDVKEQVVFGSFFRAWLQPPGRRLLPRPAVLLQARVGTPRS